MEEFTDSILINHFKISCEVSEDFNSLMIYMEWIDKSNFQFLGCLKSISEWEDLKESIQLLCINRGLVKFEYDKFEMSSFFANKLDKKHMPNKDNKEIEQVNLYTKMYVSDKKYKKLIKGLYPKKKK